MEDLKQEHYGGVLLDYVQAAVNSVGLSYDMDTSLSFKITRPIAKAWKMKGLSRTPLTNHSPTNCTSSTPRAASSSYYLFFPSHSSHRFLHFDFSPPHLCGRTSIAFFGVSLLAIICLGLRLKGSAVFSTKLVCLFLSAMWASQGILLFSETCTVQGNFRWERSKGLLLVTCCRARDTMADGAVGKFRMPVEVWREERCVGVVGGNERSRTGRGDWSYNRVLPGLLHEHLLRSREYPPHHPWQQRILALPSPFCRPSTLSEPPDGRTSFAAPPLTC
eukprot:768463-Hanusia_phi.AAC.7